MKNNTTVTTTNYISGFHYENDALKFFATAEGYVNHTLSQGISFYNYIYNYTDHLGNNRLSYTLNQTLGNVVIYEQNHYYPFGLKHEKYGVTAKQYIGDEDTGYYTGNVGLTGRYRRNEYQYKYNGKEYQDELNLNVYDYGARMYMPDIVRWGQIDPLAEKGRRWSPYVYAFNSPVFFIDPDGMSPDPPIGFNASLMVGFGSNGWSFKANASIGVGAGGSNLQGVGFAGVSVYAGQQLGTSSMTRGLQFDATVGAYATLGSGNGNSHVVNTLNADTPSGITNDFRTSVTYGQMLTFSSAINTQRDINDGGAVQRLGMIGVKAFGDASFTTSNDTGIMGGGGTDKGQTGNGTLNLGGANGFSLSYMNYTGAYDISQHDKTSPSFVGYGSFYQQTPYQQSLNQSAFRIDALGSSVIGGTSNGSIQNAIHSVTNTGQFIYPNTTTDSSNLFNLLYNR